MTLSVFNTFSIGSGATSKCMGLVTSPSFWGDAGLRKIVKDSMDLYEELAEKHKFGKLRSTLNSLPCVFQFIQNVDEFIWLPQIRSS